MTTVGEPLYSPPSKQDTRLEDYINDKLQTFADFETLDSLLANVQNQQDLLQKQLQDAQQELKVADGAYERRITDAKGAAQASEQRQADIDNRLKKVTRSDTSDDATRRFDSAMEQLRRQDMARGYLTMLDEVEELRYASWKLVFSDMSD